MQCNQRTPCTVFSSVSLFCFLENGYFFPREMGWMHIISVIRIVASRAHPKYEVAPNLYFFVFIFTLKLFSDSAGVMERSLSLIGGEMEFWPTTA